MLEVVSARREFGEHVGTALSAVNQIYMGGEITLFAKDCKDIFADDCRIPVSPFVVIVKASKKPAKNHL